VPLLPRHRAEAAAFRAGERRHPSVHELPVARIESIADDAVAITFGVPESLERAYRFAHGQHVTLLHPEARGVRRSYSICAPAHRSDLRIGVRRIPGGMLSTYLTTRLREGDLLPVMTPTGGFTTQLQPMEKRRYVALAGGSGITPIISMVWTILEAERGSAVTLIYANRTPGSTMFRHELEGLERRYAGRLTIHHHFSRQPSSGRLSRPGWERMLVEGMHTDEVDSWLLCGPAGLMQDATDVLVEHGVAPARITREFFVPGPDTLSDAQFSRPLLISEVVVRYEGRSATLPLSSRGPTILTAALSPLPDLPYSCTSGLCATCRAKVVEGEVEMDRCSGLDAVERREGWILTCQAHPVTRRVVVDFDVP
jgi:ring-1,2-phenylacetyl-CoA epoxidase subunit PaaE